MIGYDGESHYIGSFSDEQEAARAYDAAARKHHGAKARLNFPSDDESESEEEKELTPSDYRGVERQSKSSWNVRIGYDGENHYVGSFTNEQEAARAYDAAAREYAASQGNAGAAEVNFPAPGTDERRAARKYVPGRQNSVFQTFRYSAAQLPWLKVSAS